VKGHVKVFYQGKIAYSKVRKHTCQR
jgi:hypothetical protein